MSGEDSGMLFERGRGLGGTVAPRTEKRARTPEDAALERVHQVLQEVEGAVVAARGLATLPLEEWREQKAKLDAKRSGLGESFKDVALEADRSPTAKDRYARAQEALASLDAELARTTPPRSFPAVAREEEVEAQIVSGALLGDELLAWAAGLSASERAAVERRYQRAATTVRRDDTFAVALSNYLGRVRVTREFLSVLREPKRFKPATPAPTPAAGQADDGVGADGASVDEDAKPSELAAATTNAAEPVPHKEEMEASFGRDFSDVRAWTGANELRGLSTQAVTQGNVIAFADAAPSVPLIAHELAHVEQQDRAGTMGLAAKGDISAPDDPTEQEAEAVAAAVSAGRPAKSVRIAAAPAAELQLAGMGDVRIAEARAADQIEAEPRIRALISQAVAADDVGAIQARKRALLEAFQAVPAQDRPTLERRLNTPKDELGLMFKSRLSSATRASLLRVLAGEPVPLPHGNDAGELSAFVANLSEARFFLSPADVILEPGWRKAQAVEVHSYPGWAPPMDGGSMRVDWKLRDRLGETVDDGTLAWPAGSLTCPPILLSIKDAGRWEVRIEVVDQGQVLKTVVRSFVARSAKDDGSDLPRLLAGADIRARAAEMSDAEVSDQLAAARQQMGAHEVGGDRTGDATYAQLRQAIHELEWQQSQRVPEKGQSPAAGGNQSELALEDAYTAREPTAKAPERARFQQRLDQLIAQHGLKGARERIGELEQDLANDEASIHGGTLQVSSPIGQLRAELATREAEASAFLTNFESTGRAIAFGLLAESETRVRGELKRYGLDVKSAEIDRAREHAPKEGADTAQLDDCAKHAKLVLDAYKSWQEAQENTGLGFTREQANERREQFDAQKTIALAKHPMLRAFIAGEKQDPHSPDLFSAGTMEGAHLGMHMGWELNKKLQDIGTTRENIGGGDLSILGVPKLVQMTKQQMHVAPGAMFDGVVNEKLAGAGAGWTEELLAAVTLGLGLLLAIPTGGGSLAVAGAVAAGELALLAADLYLLGKSVAEYEKLKAASNTDLSVADSLIEEEPSAAPLILGFLGAVVGVPGALGEAVTFARRGMAAVRELRAAAQAGAAASPEVLAAVERLRPIARRAGMSDDEIDAMVRTALRGGPADARAASRILDTAGEATAENAQALARELGVPGVVRDAELAPGTVRVEIKSPHDAKAIVPTVRFGKGAKVADVLAHKQTIDAVERYNGILGKVRQTWDQLVDVLARTRRANPHGADDLAFEGFEEVRKYESFIRTRMSDLLGQLAHGGDNAVRAAGRLEDEILLMEGELSHWQSVLEEVRRTGVSPAARGFIEQVGDVTKDALAKGYPKVDEEKYLYRRWPGGGGPEGQEFQIIRKSGVDDVPPVQARRSGDTWVLKENEGGRVPLTFDEDLADADVLVAMRAQSESLRQYESAMRDKLQLAPTLIEQRMQRVVVQVRTPRGATPADVAGGARRAVDEDNLRHALKQEFKEEFFTAAAKEPTSEAAMVKFRETTADLNQSDYGNLMEDFLHRGDPGSVRHVDAGQASLAGQKPPVTISQDRQIDRMRPNGEAVEVKSGAGELSGRERQQLKDYSAMRGAKVIVNRTEIEIQRVVYQFTDPSGAKANLDLIEVYIGGDRISFEVFNGSGQMRSLLSDEDLVGLMEWLDR